jgi:hypothetical protein
MVGDVMGKYVTKNSVGQVKEVHKKYSEETYRSVITDQMTIILCYVSLYSSNMNGWYYGNWIF